MTAVHAVGTEVAAVMLGCTGRHIRHLVQRGQLINYGTARRILVDIAAVDRHIRHAE